jgi:hypothetical protein
MISSQIFRCHDASAKSTAKGPLLQHIIDGRQASGWDKRSLMHADAASSTRFGDAAHCNGVR